MRETTVSTMSVKYPDAVAWVFSPVGLIVSDTSNSFRSLDVSIKVGTKSVVELRYTPYNGNVQVDLSGVLQSLFDFNTFCDIDYSNIADAKTAKEVSITIMGVSSFTFTTKIIWGRKIIFGVDDIVPTKVVHVKGLPMTVDILNGTELKSVPVGDGDAVVSYSGVSVEVEQREREREDIYMRWINDRGCMCYFAFTKKKVDTKTKDTSNDVPYNGVMAKYDGHIYYYDRVQGKEATDMVTAYTTLEDINTRKQLLTLLSSAYVDLYDEANDAWLGVNVNAMTYSNDASCLADFAFSFEMPNNTTQRL